MLLRPQGRIRRGRRIRWCGMGGLENSQLRNLDFVISPSSLSRTLPDFHRIRTWVQAHVPPRPAAPRHLPDPLSRCLRPTILPLPAGLGLAADGRRGLLRGISSGGFIIWANSLPIITLYIIRGGARHPVCEKIHEIVTNNYSKCHPPPTIS